MSQPTPDPTRWLTELMSTEHVMWPDLHIADTAKAMTAAAAPWTKAVADITALQLEALKTLAAPWTALMPGSPSPAAGPIKDRRFADDAWSKDPRYEAVARTYLTQTDLMRKALAAAPLDERSKAQWGFALQQVMDALSPANTLATNPEALQLAMETGGASLLEGMRLFTEDLAKGRIAMTDETAFEVGRNVGTTPGTVVFQNEIIQLIQYTPTTAKVYKRPLVIIPPCINKYYILDLQPANSFVGHAVAEGHTVFLASWRNANADMGTLTWDDYVSEGVIKAIGVAQEITGADKVNTLGFCIGGTLLASALSVLAARDEHPAASMTLLTTLLDFSETGDLGLLVTPEMLAKRESAIGKGGLLKGSELAQVFASLRANDLIWPYVVKGYLKGQAPPPFDLLYWNSDDTNLPGPFFCWYLRNCYLDNKVREPGGTTQLGQPVDLRSIDVPTFLYASKEDHIVPWKSSYASTQLLSNDVTFVLGASGHIAGVINPPAKNKRNYWTNDTLDAEPEGWFDGAEKVAGSWWPAWYAWLAPQAGTQVVARKKPGSATYTPVEEAPGAYVREKAS
ncbi:PHA/PHB synthase family protein [Pseudonocardia charpentierae]|uniref:Class I poly(R)-hydroxyalkanoic acid synthase n=1 Tax=Pseudonocardia charpentierae TaxID=3075545 RepID=A0ABU2N7B6_9PSEU|nr:class I poly(R)-hydroxyalkanoic acid synthase [Pseudonocardia sp. DSM 45834]MDT0349818.1 class I poly(R)-hydroxyalkanoic acid synthase [Pseudonocardia sp. DSM 45834]